MSKPERLNYISAIQCLLHTPARYPKSVVPGGVSRFDDLVATHVLQLNQNHGGVSARWTATVDTETDIFS